jgi:predicted ATPase
MYTSFEVRNFRCFRDLTITGFDRVNLIAGVNNVGKTALLEALFLHCGAYNPELAMRINAFRGIETMKVTFGKWVKTPWDSLFYQFDTQAMVELKSENTATGSRSLMLRVVRQPWELATSGKFTKHPEEYQGLLSSSEFAQVFSFVQRFLTL